MSNNTSKSTKSSSTIHFVRGLEKADISALLYVRHIAVELTVEIEDTLRMSAIFEMHARARVFRGFASVAQDIADECKILLDKFGSYEPVYCKRLETLQGKVNAILWDYDVCDAIYADDKDIVVYSMIRQLASALEFLIIRLCATEAE